jgi:hypothetical protein
MSQDGFKRKLAAILSADVEGYSRLMGEDEEATFRTLKSYRRAIADLVHLSNNIVGVLLIHLGIMSLQISIALLML